MEAILAASLFSLGRNVAGNLIDALTQPDGTTFQDVLAQQTTSSAAKTLSTADVAEIRSAVDENGQLLASTKEVQSFVGKDGSFTVRPESGGSFSIVRDDGMHIRLPHSSMAEKYAAALNKAQCSLIRAEGGTVPALSDCAWLVEMPE